MVNKNNKTCINCGTRYYFCSGNCAESLNKPSWMNMFCSENCKNLFMGATDYNAKEITITEAKQIVKSADLLKKNNFNEGVKRFVNEILEEIKKDQIVSTETIKKEMPKKRQMRYEKTEL